VADLLGLLAVAFVSALLPLVNVEAYLGVRAAVADVEQVWLLGLVAAAGQMAGKAIWYYVGASSLDWGWIRRRIDRPRAQERLTRWRARTGERPLLAGSLLFVSALSGLPPFAILAVLAGQLRMSLPVFLVLGLLGRWLRFAVILGGVDWLLRTGLV
jgi:membrane protein YqaA with SNARE-associated domain